MEVPIGERTEFSICPKKFLTPKYCLSHLKNYSIFPPLTITTRYP